MITFATFLSNYLIHISKYLNLFTAKDTSCEIISYLNLFEIYKNIVLELTNKTIINTNEFKINMFMNGPAAFTIRITSIEYIKTKKDVCIGLKKLFYKHSSGGFQNMIKIKNCGDLIQKEFEIQLVKKYGSSFSNTEDAFKTLKKFGWTRSTFVDEN